MQVQSYRDLVVWQKSRGLVKSIYLIIGKFPSTERFGLVDQIKRAVISIVANIAEGKQRQSKKNMFSFCILHTVLVRKLKLF